jgi:hypothetical protein
VKLYQLKYLIFIGSCLFFLSPLIGQDKDAVTFELSLSKEALGINERLRVDFTMNKDGDNFNPPNFEGFRVP